MSAHTPGPWTVGKHQRIISQGWSIRIADDSAIAYVLGDKNPELAANACLIAATPDLLEALKAILNCCGEYSDWQQGDYPYTEELMHIPTINAARAAIAKATGGDK